MFDNFISLGWFCGTAGSLAKYGFRNKSYPFDWCFSDFKGVLHFIDTNFSDFMIKENLSGVPDRPREFIDVKYNMHFNHDVKSDFDKEYPDIYKKYLRRINRFRTAIQNPSCFFRAIRNEKELQYIVDNQDYIRNVVQKGNSLNEIVFLIPRWFKNKNELSFPSFTLNFDDYSGTDKEAIRGMLDNNNDVIEYLQSNITVQDIASNLIWDRDGELKQRRILESRYNIAIKLLNNDLDLSLLPRNIVIYGAGNIGKAFFNKCKDICNVKGFVDEDPSQDEYKGTQILSLNKVNEIPCENYIVTPIYDSDKIQAWFSENYPNVNLIPVDSLLKK